VLRFCSVAQMIVACGALLAMIASSIAFVQYDLPAIGYLLIYAASFFISIRCYDGMLFSRFLFIRPASSSAPEWPEGGRAGPQLPAGAHTLTIYLM
jgi:hypothetical protein